jgi:hypothetical protein
VSEKIASESGHWYCLRTGEPRYTVIGKNGKERNTTLSDARRNGYVPSVTQIVKDVQGIQPGLLGYLERQLFEATIREGGPAIHESVEWDRPFSPQEADMLFSHCREASKEHSRKAAEQGTALHGAIERWLIGHEPEEEAWIDHVESLHGALRQYGIDLLGCGEPEKSFAHEMGFGGKVDYQSREGDGLILDFKSKPCIVPGKRYGYDNHIMQLAAYAMGLGMPNARGINVFIGVEDKKVLVNEWSAEDMSRGWSMFSLLLKFWQVSKGYFPRKEAA